MARRISGVALAVCVVVLAGPAWALAAPVIANLNPSSGSTAGGTNVMITGTGLNTVISVTFGGSMATIQFTAADGTALGVTTSAHAAGTVDVTVTGGGNNTKPGGFTYVAFMNPPPTISSVTPGKASTVGGTLITINGSNFQSSATVTIGNVPATAVNFVSGAKITAMTPAAAGGIPGTTAVTVTNPDTQSVTAPFMYTTTCDSEVVDNCVESPIQINSVNNANAALQVEILTISTSVQSSVQFTIVNTANSDRFELSPAVTAADVITFVFRGAAGFDPIVGLSTGEIPGQGFKFDPATLKATLTLKPRASSWSQSPGCTIAPGPCAAQASHDYQALAIALVDSQASVPAATRTAMRGMFMATNAQSFSTPAYDAASGAFGFQIASPHAPAADPSGTNQGFFRFFVPNAFITGVWGISDPSTIANDPSNSQVTISSQVVQPTISQVAATATSPAGVLWEFANFHYSSQTVSIAIAPTIVSISPAQGSTSGGTSVTITGLNFRSGATVTIGGVAATSVTVVDSTRITAITGAHAAGAVAVVVRNSDGTSETLAAGFTYSGAGPAVSIDRTALTFAAVTTGSAFSSQTGSQTVRLTQSAGASVSWTATSSRPWLTVTPASGTGPALLSIAVKFDGSLPASGSATGAITLAGITAGPINVTLTIVSSATSPPFGVLDTPVGDATVLAGSIAITGWTLDNVGVARVELWRDLQPGETTPPFSSTPDDPRSGKVFISNATLADGARPDVEALYPSTPVNYRAGWGYLLLTWGLWNQGNGTYKLYAFGFDVENNVATIGSKTVVVSNNAATKPFGSIDTPGIGGDASGANFGWALTPKVNGVATCKIQPSGVQVSIDSGPLQPVVYGDARSDIAAAFTGFSNSTGAGGHFVFDWSTLANGPHTIGWLITDDCNRSDGVGSRFFNVTTGTSLLAATATADPLVSALVVDETESNEPITVARGYGELPKIVEPGTAGSRTIEIRQGERIELRVPAGFEAAHQLGPDGQRRALPAGATWDGASGNFYWQPAAAFLGRYRIVFSSGSERISVRIVIGPRTAR